MKWKNPKKFDSGFGSYQESEVGGYCITFQKTATGDFAFIASRFKLDFGRLYVPADAEREDLGKAAAAMRDLCERYDEMEVKA